MNNQPIGIFDSGVGGLTIWQALVKELPWEQIIYIGDSKNAPYGNKSPEQIHTLATRLIEFLLEKDVKLIVVACNTVTVHNLVNLRIEFPQVPFIGIVPVVKTAAERTKNGIIGILSTSQTAKSDYQKNLIEQFAKDKKVINIGTNELVPFIERGETDTPLFKESLAKILVPFQKANIDTLALGCSHFPFVKKQMQEILGLDIYILDSSKAIARQVRRVLTANNALASHKKPVYDFFTTGELKHFRSFLSSRAHSISSVRGDLTQKKIAASC